MKQLIFLVFFFMSVVAFGQPGNDVITPENARAKQKEQHDKIERDYLENVDFKKVKTKKLLPLNVSFKSCLPNDTILSIKEYE